MKVEREKHAILHVKSPNEFKQSNPRSKARCQEKRVLLVLIAV